MNFDPQLSTSTAVSFALLASFFWGSWAIILKYTIKLPVEIIFFVLLTAALIFIWGLGFILDGSALLSSIRIMFGSDPARVLLTLLGGFIYAFSNILGIRVMQMVGLALAQPISSSINLILGTLVSCLIGGAPSNLSLWRITLAGLLLIAAIYFSFLAGHWRPDNQEDGQGKVTGKVLLFGIIAAMAGVIYSTSISYGLKSVTHPDGLAVMPYLCLFLSGAWIGAMILCSYWISKRRGWGLVKILKPKLVVSISLASWTHYSATCCMPLPPVN